MIKNKKENIFDNSNKDNRQYLDTENKIIRNKIYMYRNIK